MNNVKESGGRAMTDIRIRGEGWEVTKDKGLMVVSYIVLMMLRERAVGWHLIYWSFASTKDVRTVLAEAPIVVCYNSDDVLWDSSWRGLISRRAMRDRSRGLLWDFYGFLPSPRAWNFVVPDWPGQSGGPTLKLASFYANEEEDADECRMWAAEQFPWLQRQLRRKFTTPYRGARDDRRASPGPEDLNYFRALPDVHEPWFMDNRYARAEETMEGRKLLVCPNVSDHPFHESCALNAEWAGYGSSDGVALAAILCSYDQVGKTPHRLRRLRPERDYLIFTNRCWWLLHHPSP